MSTNPGSYGDPETRSRLLDVTWDLVVAEGASFKLRDVAEQAGVSRQTVYLHFGDRGGLLLALVNHMDEALDLGSALAHVRAAPTGPVLLERAMRLNTDFWRAVSPVAQVLEAARHDDEELAAAWRNRMGYRREAFDSMIRQIAEQGWLAPGWTVEDAGGLLYSVAHFDTWRELTRALGWTDDHYVEMMTQLVSRALLGHSDV